MVRFLLILCVAIGFAPVAQAQEQRRPSHCIALADHTPGAAYLHKASWHDPLPDHTVRIHYIAHASFLIQSQGGLTAITDYTGFIGSAPLIPDVVTMNHAHESHWTDAPDPAIPNVLKGWGQVKGEGVVHHLDLGEMLVRNATSDIRDEVDEVERNGNSIFIFEVAGLCIGHLGHLHQELSPEQYAAIGRLDVVMVPVDGSTTLPLDAMMRVVRRLRSSVVIPMHWFTFATRDAFVAGMTPEFDLRRIDGPSIELSLKGLPDRPTIFLLRPDWLRAKEP